MSAWTYDPARISLTWLDVKLFTIDVPILSGALSEDEGGSSSQSSKGADEQQDGDQVERHLPEETDSDGPVISLPDHLVDLRSVRSSSSSSRKGKEKEPLWHDPADELVNIDLNGESRLRKLARGKAKTVKSVVRSLRGDCANSKSRYLEDILKVDSRNFILDLNGLVGGYKMGYLACPRYWPQRKVLSNYPLEIRVALYHKG